MTYREKHAREIPAPFDPLDSMYNNEYNSHVGYTCYRYKKDSVRLINKNKESLETKIDFIINGD